MDLGALTEDDVVEVFKSGLRRFMEAEGGLFGARRVTLREERFFPSDQEMSIRFDSPNGFRLHLFGLQFKRWNGTGWSLSDRQLDNLRRMGHVIGYCLPCAGDLALPNMLHGFYFINPAKIPVGSTRLALVRPGLVAPPGVSPSELADSVQSRLDLELSLEGHVRRQSLFTPTTGETISALHRIIRTTKSIVESALSERNTLATIRSDQTWGASVVSTNCEPASSVPYLCWGDFFHALALGSTTVDVPGSSDSPPDPASPPAEHVVPGAGAGLTIKCAGAWGAPWALQQVDSHVAHWTRTMLEPPAAVIAYESFSRSLAFMEHIG